MSCLSCPLPPLPAWTWPRVTWYDAARRGTMAKRPVANPNNRARRRMRIQSLLFTLLGLLVVASFVLSLIQ